MATDGKDSKASVSRQPETGLPPVCEAQLNIPAPHIESFDYFLEKGLALAVRDLQPVEIEFPELKSYLTLWINSVSISTPCHSAFDQKLYPSECRQMGATYSAPCFASICRQVNGGQIETEQYQLGRVPIMVKSEKCHIRNFTPSQMVEAGEEPNEMGGYFICNGNEKIIRLLIVPRSNNPMAIKQSKNIGRGKLYSPYGIEIRCQRPDQTTQRNVVHYLTDGNCTLRFTLFKREYFVPVVVLLKAFVSTTDREIYEKLTNGETSNTFLTDRVELLLREAKQFGVTSPPQALAFLGSRFRNAMRAPERHTDRMVGEALVKQLILVHLPSFQDKFNYLIFLVRKLYAFVAGDIQADNPDSQGNQDILLPGHLYGMIFKEQLQEFLNSIKLSMTIDVRRKIQADFLSAGYFQKCLKRSHNISARLDNFLSTGNITSNTGLDLLQKSGFTVIAEKLNYLRYLSHFRGVHRGQFFTTMKTTKVRKLLPDGWGFLCPVHTPDGSPCGLLNHLAAECQILSHSEPEAEQGLPAKLGAMGMKSAEAGLLYPSTFLPVFLNARLLGYLPAENALSFTDQLRFLKVEGHPSVPRHLEIVLLGAETRQYPGIYLFTTLGRMTRPVTNLRVGKTEWISPQEQMYMEIACVPDDVSKLTTHAEISPMNMLSIIASLTPFSDFNQSPRNMYQCQMGKQTMATPCTAYPHRVDNKMYRIQTPQIPLVRNTNQDKYRIDDYPNGTNALVAVISYTGYDMEDAMIINRSSYERGFGHGSVYKTECINLRERGCSGYEFFANPRRRLPSGEYSYHEPRLDEDGLPFIGMRLEQGDPYVCVHDTQVDKIVVRKYKSKEPAVVDHISVVRSTHDGVIQVNIKLRINRNPIIGDKFSSRHGQKGVLSKLWPAIDMPFTESGMTPDLIINPHAFPSRMTIGMLIESMAGKSACLHGMRIDATPFRFDEQHTAVDYFGEQLARSGYSYYGNEPMYSGISGTPMQADIFYGVVYYQRLRHMVSDKFQVRSTGPNNNLTRQPVKGRKLGGGIRLGEMERDSLLAHGASFMLHDRLMNCSDAHRGFVCVLCGSIISPLIQPASIEVNESRVICTYCDTVEGIRVLNLPFVYRFLLNELSAMNIRIALEVTDAAKV